MRGLVQALFYTWLIGSTIALVLHRRRKADERRAEDEARTDEARGVGSLRAARLTDPLTGATIPPAAPRADAAPVAPPAATPAPREAARPLGDGLTAGGPPAEARTRTAPDATPEPAASPGPPPAEGSGRRGLFAPEPAPAQAPATIAEALRGVEWPCGLTPVVVLDDLHQADRRVVFATSEAPGPEVGSRVGDALEAAGFELTSLDDASALARRSDATVALRIHPEAGKATRDGQPLFPTLPAEAVVLVCDLRAG